MGNFIKVTEQASRYNDLEKMSIQEILTNINKEDKTEIRNVNICFLKHDVAKLNKEFNKIKENLNAIKKYNNK